MIDLAIIDFCKNQNVDTQIIEQIIEVESSGNEYAINVNDLKKSFKPKTKEAAKELALNYIEKGYSVDIGLMQFNSKNLNSSIFSHYSVDDLLDRCKNIKAGSDIFYLAYESIQKYDDENDRISKALSIYNTGNQNFGFENGYVTKYSYYSPKNNNIIYSARNSLTKLNLNLDIYYLENEKYTKKTKDKK